MAEIARPVKTKLIAIIVLGVTTFAFGTGFFVFLGLEYFGPEPDVGDTDDIRLIDQDLHVEGTFNRYFNESSKQIYFLIPYEDYYHYRQEMERDIPYQDFIRPNSVRFIAEYIRDNVANPLDDECVLMGILSFVQDRGPNNASMHYIYDSDTSGAKFPLEFFCEGGGDCEDASIAFQSLAQSLGYQTLICFSPQHCFAAVRMDQPPSVNVDYDPYYIEVDGEFYYTVEGTGYGWMLGQLPSSIDPNVVTWEHTYTSI